MSNYFETRAVVMCDQCGTRLPLPMMAHNLGQDVFTRAAEKGWSRTKTRLLGEPESQSRIMDLCPKCTSQAVAAAVGDEPSR